MDECGKGLRDFVFGFNLKTLYAFIVVGAPLAETAYLEL